MEKLPDMSKATILLFGVILTLAASMVCLLQRQARSSLEGKVIEVGLIESGGMPALYFNLRNTGGNYANYTYTIRYNSTDRGLVADSSSIMVPPGQTFYYTAVLTRPSQGVMVLNLKIYRGGGSVEESLLHDQTWIIRAQR